MIVGRAWRRSTVRFYVNTIDSGHCHLWVVISLQHVQSLAETLGDAVWSKPLWIQFHSFPLLPGEVFH